MTMDKKIHVCPLKHVPVMKNYEAVYTCDGCKELGIGPRYRCDPCDYDLHKDCMCTTNTAFHDFFQNATFVFMDHPPRSGYSCDACMRPINGFLYHCKDKGLDLHPCCRGLSNELDVSGVTFRLYDKVYSACFWCNKKKPSDAFLLDGWSYVSECNNYHLHVYCAMEMAIHVLNGKKLHQTPQVNTSSFGRAEARLSLGLRILNLGVGVGSLLLGDPSPVIINLFSSDQDGTS